jgi:hypothetical protein
MALKWLSQCFAHAPSGSSLPVSPVKHTKFCAASSQAGWVRFSLCLYFCSKRSISRTRGGLDLSWMGLVFLRERILSCFYKVTGGGKCSSNVST